MSRNGSVLSVRWAKTGWRCLSTRLPFQSITTLQCHPCRSPLTTKIYTTVCCWKLSAYIALNYYINTDLLNYIPADAAPTILEFLSRHMCLMIVSTKKTQNGVGNKEPDSYNWILTRRYDWLDRDHVAITFILLHEQPETHWCPRTKAAGHQYPQSRLNINCADEVLYRNIAFIGNSIRTGNYIMKKYRIV